MTVQITGPNYMLDFASVTDGVAFGNNNFAAYKFAYYTENNNFYTTDELETMDGTPGPASPKNYVYYATEFVDLDGDRDLDIVVAADAEGGEALYFYENRRNEGGIWEDKLVIDSGFLCYRIAHGDIDNDGDDDLLVSDDSTGRLIMYKNTFGLPASAISTAGHGGADGPDDIVVANVTGNYKMEVVVAVGGKVVVYTYKHLPSSGPAMQ